MKIYNKLFLMAAAFAGGCQLLWFTDLYVFCGVFGFAALMSLTFAIGEFTFRK